MPPLFYACVGPPRVDLLPAPPSAQPDTGARSVEYALMAALISVGVAGSVAAFATTVAALFVIPFL